MASQIEEILGRQINSVKELKNTIKSLQDSLIGVDAESQEFKDTTAKLTAAQDELTKVTRAGKEENTAAKDSLVGMRQEYKALYDQYKMLTEEQRKSDFGKNMAASLETLSNKINDTQKGVGDFRGNVGRYAQDITDVFNTMGVSVGALQGPLKLATTGFKGLNSVMKGSPVGWIAMAIAALIAIFNKLKEAIGNNEEHQMRMNEAMAKFQPIIDSVKNAIDWLAGAIVKYIEFVGNAVQKMREFAAAVTDFLGITKGAKQQLQETQKIYDDIAKSTNNLTKQKREYQKLNADNTAEVQRLRELASETKNREEKQRLLTEAKEKQAEIDQRNIEIAEEELRVLELQAQLTANDAEMNDKLAAATARVSEAQATAANNARAFNKQLNSTTSSASSAGKAVKNYREEAKKLYEQIIEDNKDEITKLTEKYEKEKKLLKKYHYDTTLLTKKYNADVNKIEREAADKIYQQSAKIYQQRRDDNEQELNLWRTRGKEEIALALESEKLEKVTIPAVQKLDETVTNFLKSFKDNSKLPDLDAALAKMKEMEDFINDNTFEALGDEFKPIKDAVRKVNDEFGLSITTVSNLTLTLEELETKFANITKEYNELVDEKAGEEQIKKIQEAIKENYVAELEGLIKTVSYDTFEGYTVFMAEQEAKALEVEKSAIEQELNNFSGTTEQKLEIMQRYYEVLAEMREKDQALSELNQQRTQEMVDNLADAMDNIGSSLGTVKSSYESLIDSEVKAGKIDEKQANEKKKRLAKLEIAQQAFSIATIAADAASGLFSIWKGYATEVGTVNPQTAAAAGPASAGVLAGLNAKSLVSAIAKSAGLAATATAQIMAAKNGIVTAVNGMSESGGGGSDVGVAASPMVIGSTPYSYTRTVQTAEEEDRLNQPIWCSIVDIENALDHRVVVKDESSF